jgi:hypothetical protein
MKENIIAVKNKEEIPPTNVIIYLKRYNAAACGHVAR